MKNYIPNNANVYITGLTEDGTALTKDISIPEDVKIPSIELVAGEDPVEVNNTTDAASVEFTVNLNNFEPNVEATIDFTSSFGEISDVETTSDHTTTVKLVASDITAARDAKVTATISEVKDPSTGENFPEYRENISAVSETVTFDPDFSGDDSTVTYNLVKAVADQADRLTVFVEKEVT